MADNIIVKDATGANKTMRTTDLGSDIHAGHHIPLVGGAPVATGNPLPVDIVDAQVEIINDVGNPLPVAFATAQPVQITNTPSVAVSGNVEITNDVGNAIPVSSSQLPTLGTGVPNSNAGALPSREVGQETWVCSFANSGASVLSSDFNPPIVGAGVTYNQTSGSLNILTGTNTNAEFLARSAASWRGAMRMRASLVASQRIANQNFAVMLADFIGENLTYNIVSSTVVNVTLPAHGFTAQNVGQFMNLGGITGVAGVPGRYAIAAIPDANTIQFTVAGWPASGTGTLMLFGWNYVRNLVNGTVATNMAFDAQRRGWASGDTTATINTTASSGTIIQNDLNGRDIFLSDSLRASTTTPNVTTRASRYENIPDDNVPLFVFIWSFNGTVAPASTTTWTLGFIAVERFANMPVFLQGSRANGTQNPLPVQAQANATVNIAQVGGTATVNGGTAGLLGVGGQGAAGAAVAGNPVRIAGSDGTNARNILTDASGNMFAINPLPTSVADVASAALTTTTTTAAFTPTFGQTYEVNIPVTAVSGTTPTLDVGVEESDDGGTNWYRVYDFPRITATGMYRSPKLTMTGNRVRYVQTVGGTTPSFTRAINRLQSTESVQPIRQIIDRALAVNTINSATASLNVQNCRNAQLVIDMGAVTTTPPAIQIEGSDNNGATWYAVGTALTSVASTTNQVAVNNIQSQLLRARVSTAGVGATLNSVTLKGF